MTDKKKSAKGTAAGATKDRAPAEAMDRAPPEAAPSRDLSVEEVRGELRLLARVRAKFAPLSSAVSAGLYAQHDDDACRGRATATRAPDTFSGAMGWGRAFESHAVDPAFAPLAVRIRWFFDCLTVLGEALTGAVGDTDPAKAAAFADAEQAAEALIEQARERVGGAIGSNAAWRRAFEAATTPAPPFDARVSTLRQLAALVESWLWHGHPPAVPGGEAAKPRYATWLRSAAPGARDTVPALAAYGVEMQFAHDLAAAAARLDEALANRPAPRKIERDSPAVNAAEGRLQLIMRDLWDAVGAMRKAGTTTLLLPVTPALLRGLNLERRQKRPAGTPKTGGATG